MIGGLLASSFFLIYLCTSNRIIMENRRCGSILSCEIKYEISTFPNGKNFLPNDGSHA